MPYIENKLNAKSILKNKENPNYEQESENLAASITASNDNSSDDDQDGLDDAQYLGRGGNKNKARCCTSRKDMVYD